MQQELLTRATYIKSIQPREVKQPHVTNIASKIIVTKAKIRKYSSKKF